MQLIARVRQQPVFYGLVFLLLLIGCGLRLYHLGQLQAGAHQDELSNIYDGYSIAQTGADRWGQKFPVILRAFGKPDYRPPLYAWLSALMMRVFGFSVASGRLVSALLGSATLGLVYLVGRRLGGQLFAFFALLLVTFSPWHLLYSRLAHEGTMLPAFFVVSACYLWQRAGSTGYRPRYVGLLGLCVGLGTNTYQAGKLVFLLFALLVLADLWRHHKRFWRTAALFAGSCLVGVAPQLVALASRPEQFFSRAAATALPFSFSWGYFSTLFSNLASHLTPDFLFFSFGQQNNLSAGRLLKVEFLPFYVGLWFLYQVFNRQQTIRPAYFYLLLLFTALPAALTSSSPNALRDSSLAVLLPFVTAAGLVFMYQQLRRPLLRRAFVAVAAVLVVGNGIDCIATYAKADDLREVDTQLLLVETAKKIELLQSYYHDVYLEKFGNQPYIYVLTYCGVTPQQFQQASLKVTTSDGWDNFEQLDNYYFLSREAIEEKLKRSPTEALVVLKSRTKNYQLLDSVECRNEKTYFYACHAQPPAQ